MRLVFVHGACVQNGQWWWHRMDALLRQRGIRSVAAQLPSCGETGLPVGSDGPGLADDVAAVRRVLDASDEPTIVVAHSYGGIVASEACAGVESLRHLALVSSYLPLAGETLADFGSATPAPFLRVDPAAGTFEVRPELFVDTFLHDCDEDIQAQAAGCLARQSVRVLTDPVTVAAWQQLPTTYLICGRDRGTPAARQREFASRADTVVELDAGHHPFLSQPDVLRDVLLDLPVADGMGS